MAGNEDKSIDVATIDMLDKGLLLMDRIVTHKLPLSEFQRGIDLVAAGDRSIKVTLEP